MHFLRKSCICKVSFLVSKNQSLVWSQVTFDATNLTNLTLTNSFSKKKPRQRKSTMKNTEHAAIKDGLVER